MSNIAEGWYRSRPEWARYMRIAFGSAAELESQLILAKELCFITTEDFDEILTHLDQIQRLLNYYTHKTTSDSKMPNT